MWYDGKELISRARLINIVRSMRGPGKTTFFLRRCLERGYNKNIPFVWLRRYKSEVQADFTSKFFLPLIKIAQSCPEEFTSDERNFILSMDWKLEKNNIIVNKKIIGNYYPLSLTLSKKSIPFVGCRDVVYDEFVIKPKSPQHYLPDEPIVFLEFLSTVFRDESDKSHAYLLGNNVTFNDPYSIYFNILPTEKRFAFIKNPANGRIQIVSELWNDEDFEKKMRESSFGQLTEGTQYGRYAINSQSLYETGDFIEEKPAGCEFRCAIKWKGSFYGFWRDFSNGKMYVDKRYDSTSKALFSLTRDDHSINTILIVNRKNFHNLREIALYFSHGQLLFINEHIKAQVMDFIQYII